jgi:hypothetical protein
MDAASLATGMVSARTAQVQMALAARLMQAQQITDMKIVTQLLASAEANMKQMTAAAQEGIGQMVDITA